MPAFGYKLMCEEHGPRELVENAVRADGAGFDFVGISDHFLPWLEEEGHAPFAWSVLGAIASRTRNVDLLTAVTCPTFRYHPAIVAQAAATISLLCGDGRFSLGLGSGELLNEHVVGGDWPSIGERHARLEEALEVIQALLDGGRHSFRGQHVELAEARLYDVPETPPPLVLAAGGPHAAVLAGELCDGMIATEPREDLVRSYEGVGGNGARYGELAVCWAEDERRGMQELHRAARWSVLGWKALPELPTPAAFAAATKTVRPEDLATSPCGPDPKRYVDAVRRYVEAGFDHVLLVQIGRDQEGFFRFWENELQEAVSAVQA